MYDALSQILTPSDQLSEGCMPVENNLNTITKLCKSTPYIVSMGAGGHDCAWPLDHQIVVFPEDARSRLYLVSISVNPSRSRTISRQAHACDELHIEIGSMANRRVMRLNSKNNSSR